MRGHDAFEALSGAVILGEATTAERALFDEHALACAACREDVSFASQTTRSIEAARDAEVWRPSVATPVLERIARTRGRRRERTIGAFGWAIALSLVVNVAIASGITSGSFSALRHTPDGPSDVTATTIHFEKARARTVATNVLGPARVARVVVPHARAHHRTNGATTPLARTHPSLRAVAAKSVDSGDVTSARKLSAVPTVDESASSSEPDVLAGLEIERSENATLASQAARSSRRVAVEAFVCERFDERDSWRDVSDACAAPATPIAR